MISEPNTLKSVINKSLDFIITAQSDDGSWTDWDVEGDWATPWTSAYVGYQFRFFPHQIKKTIVPNLAKTAFWLEKHENSECGWSYSDKWVSDSDSTAFATLYLRSVNWPVNSCIHDFLARFQRSDGGFTTFLPTGIPNSQNISHVDVTTSALFAMCSNITPDWEVISKGIEFITDKRMPGGYWNSFWWDSYLYSTAFCLDFLHSIGKRVPFPDILNSTDPKNAFETALLLLCLLFYEKYQHSRIEDLINILLSSQLWDGSWKSEPILRIPPIDCFEPWDSLHAGKLYADPKRLFTTATVLGVLSRIHFGRFKMDD